MTEGMPVFVGMPPTERTFAVHPWPGRIICGGVCKDDYGRIVTKHYGTNDRLVVTLQRAAMDSFLDACEKIGPIVLTGSWRSCAQQTDLWRSDKSRFAPPNTTAHVRGLAIDVSTATSAKQHEIITRALLARGWHQARADEPWHFSFGIEV
jgi:LAS superfamily LD-carboxypeptidase LdcB